MDLATLKQAMGNDVISDEELAGYNDAMVKADVTTVDRAVMFAAQIGHESVGLRYYEEIASGADYEWRSDLGNTQAGDGVRFKGRGPIQVTGRANYAALSRWAFDRGYVPTATYFVDNPAQLGTIRYGFYGAAWFWSTHPGINAAADQGDVHGATRIINGGLNGITDRINRWNHCRSLGSALLPGGFLMALNDGQQGQVWTGAAQFSGPSNVVRWAPDWLRKFLPRSFSDPNGVWVRDEIDALVNEMVTGVFDFTTPIDFGDGKGPIPLHQVPPEQPVNFTTMLRIIGARQAKSAGLIK